jgi:hypothetical protein
MRKPARQIMRQPVTRWAVGNFNSDNNNCTRCARPDKGKVCKRNDAVTGALALLLVVLVMVKLLIKENKNKEKINRRIQKYF